MEKPTEYTLTWEVTDEMTAKRIGSAGSKMPVHPQYGGVDGGGGPRSWRKPIWTKG